MKSNSWFKKVKGNVSKKSEDVVVNVGILAWSEKTNCVKPIRGKRVCLRVQSNATYECIRSDGLKTMTDFYRDLIEENINYSLAFESGEIAYFIPGTSDDFILQRYKEELGKDYKNITLYLLSENDKVVLDKMKNNPFDNDDDEFDVNTVFENNFDVPHKKFKCESMNECNQLDKDEIYAESLQALFNEMPDLVPDFCETREMPEIVKETFKEQASTKIQIPNENEASIELILEELSKNVNTNGQFFLM